MSLWFDHEMATPVCTAGAEAGTVSEGMAEVIDKYSRSGWLPSDPEDEKPLTLEEGRKRGLIDLVHDHGI